MFPVNSQNFPLKGHESIVSYVTGSAKLLVPGKVTAATSIPHGAVTDPIEGHKLLGHPDVMQISAESNLFGQIDLDRKSRQIWCQSIHWVRALRLSDDCHSYNVQLKLEPCQKTNSHLDKKLMKPKLVLQTVKPIEPGQELLLWFSEDILAILQIAFLTPANIQGQKKYVCTKCSALYESPNPLKLHISLACNRYTIASLWEKLANSFQRTDTMNNESFDFKLSPEPQLSRQRSAIDLSLSSGSSKASIPENPKNFYRPFSESSAFKPFRKTPSELPVNGVPRWPIRPIDLSACQEPLINENEAHIETLVSSLGKSKHGHICLYCGKCYSRKYGLKIHIRTHTGYKPLKCKFCMRPFGDPSNLNKHVRLHAEGSTPYKCDLCGKVLVRRRDLDRHLKSRHMIDMHPDLNILQEDTNQEASNIESQLSE